MTRTRNTTLALALSAAAVSFALFATPAYATDTQTALNMCADRGDECIQGRRGPGGNYELWVDNEDGMRLVVCPPEPTGQCWVEYRRAPRRDLRDNANVAGNAGVNRGAQAPSQTSPIAPYLLNDTDAQLHARTPGADATRGPRDRLGQVMGPGYGMQLHRPGGAADAVAETVTIRRVHIGPMPPMLRPRPTRAP